MRDVLEMGLGERTVVVEKSRLLSTLKENRQKHQREYDDAVAGYKQLATERLTDLKSKAASKLDSNFESIQARIDAFDPDDGELTDVVTLLSSMTFNLKVPRNHVESYNVAIEMAEWETRDEIELTQRQFQCFVLDDWDWQNEFKALSKTYTQAMR